MPLERRLRLLGNRVDTQPRPSLHVAFASSDRRHVDQHFGAASGVVIYAVGPDCARLVEAAEFGTQARDGHENKLAAKFAVLADCQAVYCNAVGASAVRRMVALGIQPCRVSPGTAIASLIEELQYKMGNQPGGWLARALQQEGRQQDGDHANRFDAMAEEAWEP